MAHKRIRPKEIIRQRNRRLLAVTVLIVLFLAVYSAHWWMSEKDWVSTDDAFVAGHLVTVKSQTEGNVVEILAENTQAVAQGQLLVRLDGTKAQIELRRAEAELAVTVRNIVTLRKSVETVKQRIAAKQAELDLVRHDFNRLQGAMKDGAASAQQVQNAQDKTAELQASITALYAEKSGIDAQVEGTELETHPAVEKAKNLVRQAFLAYQRRNIYAPVAGVVAKRRIQTGDLVKEGAPLMVVVPMDDLWVDANFLESQIERIRPGQQAEISADVYGEKIIYHGKVQGINPATGSSFALLPPDNASGNFIHVTERVPVRIGLKLEELKTNPLRLGLSTVTRINTVNADGDRMSSSVETKNNTYRTSIYEHELNGVEELIQNIIIENNRSTIN